MEYHVNWGSSSGCGNRQTAIRPPYLKNFRARDEKFRNLQIIPEPALLNLKEKYYFERKILLWKESIILKGKYYFERKVLLWKESITLKGKYYFERKILFWKENITLKGKYYFERKVLLWKESITLKGKYY